MVKPQDFLLYLDEAGVDQQVRRNEDGRSEVHCLRGLNQLKWGKDESTMSRCTAECYDRNDFFVMHLMPHSYCSERLPVEFKRAATRVKEPLHVLDVG